MRIDALQQINQVYESAGTTKVKRSAKVSDSDKLEISEFGKDLQIAKQAVANASDVREDKIAEFKSRIAAGTYDVSPEDFADKLLERAGEFI